MLLRKFCLGNNLQMPIRVNTDFPWQKPSQLPSAKANLEGCIICMVTHRSCFFSVVAKLNASSCICSLHV